MSNNPITTSINRYERYRERMIITDTPIPNWVLRDYLDTLRLVAKYRPGLSTMVITITRESSLNFFRYTEIPPEAVIHIPGQKVAEP